MTVYLASAYTSKDVLVQTTRFLWAMDCTQWFLKEGYHVYSPIVHCHQMASLYGLPHDFPFWQKYDHAMIEAMSEFWILQDPDRAWTLSSGVASDLKMAEELGKQVSYVWRLPNGSYGIDRGGV